MLEYPRLRPFSLITLALTSLFAGTPAIADAVKPTEPVTLINAFEVPADRVGDTIAFWEKAKKFLEQQPGYISTNLHQALTPDARFQLVNVAQWDSPDAFRLAIGKLRESDLGAGMKGISFNAALYRIIRTDEGTEQ